MLDFEPMEKRHNMMPGSLELAYLGDTLFDLFVRTRLVKRGGRMKQLHREAVSVVCAKAQSEALGRIEEDLTEPEQEVVRRARNCKKTPTKNADPLEYARATSLEALFGYLYVQGEAKRLDELMNKALGNWPFE